MSISLKDKIYERFLILLIVCLSFSKALPNIFLAFGILFYLAFIVGKEKGLDKRFYLNYISALLLFLFFKKIFNQTIFEEFNSLSRLTIIVIIPILFSIISKNKIIFSYIVSVFIGVFMSLLKIILFYIENKSLPFSNDSEVNNLLFLERPYMGFACLTASLLLIYLAKEFPKIKFFLIILSFLLTLFIFLIAARLSIITILFLLASYLFFYSRFSIMSKIIIFTIGIFVFISALINYRNLSNRFF